MSVSIDKSTDRFNTTSVLVIPSTTQNNTDEPVNERSSPHIQPRDSGLFLIGIFKLFKAVFFMSVSLGALHFVHHDLSSTVERMMRELHFDPESHVVDLVMDKVGQVTHHRLRLISMGTSLYGALCTTEAYGLLTRKVWAEYVTLWLSISFIPWELYEMVRRPSLWHASILATNILVVVYLLWMLRRKKSRQQVVA
ncbi:MAG: DUF2127 domain-containing protein [Janthinobacterium lividum]